MIGLIISLAIIIVIFSHICVSSDYIKPDNVAVCVSGQLSRFLPEYIASGLIKPNPSIYFLLFLNMQYKFGSASGLYSTDSHLSFHQTNLTSLTQTQLSNYLHNLLATSNNSEMISLVFTNSEGIAYWEKIIQRSPLDRIHQYTSIQPNILNMYRNQYNCISQIESYESLTGNAVDYVISSREDLYYFYGLNLSYLLSFMKQQRQLSSNHKVCDMISKECLAWTGLNMRWQLFTRNASIFMMKRRFEYYQSLYSTNQTFLNPEIFEKQQSLYYGLKVCDHFLIDFIPNIAARHVQAGHICFAKPETIDYCVPNNYTSFVAANLCHKAHKRFRMKAPITRS